MGDVEYEPGLSETLHPGPGLRDELADVHAVLAERGADGGRRRRLAARALELDLCFKFFHFSLLSIWN